MTQSSDDGGGRTQERRGSLARHSTLAAAAGAVAVLSGIVFDAAIAIVYGAGAASDAFFVAARIPMGIQVVLTVASNQALVPLFSTWITTAGLGETNRRVSMLAGAGTLIGLGLALLGAVLAWPLMRLTAPGLSTAQIDVAAATARIMFLVIPLEVLGDVFEGFLNARYSFVVPSGAKAVRNITAAGLLVGFAGDATEPELIAWAYLIGMVLLVITEVLTGFVRGFRYTPRLGLRDPYVREAARLSRRPLAGAAINPLTRLVEQQFVSFLPTGAITIQQYAYRLISAVGGTVFFRSIMVAIVPRLTEATARGRDAAVARLTRLGTEIMLMLSLPLMVVVAILARPAVIAIFQRGKFSAEDAALLGACLVAYSFSLPGSGVQRSLLAPFIARLDTKTPLWNTIWGNLANIAFLPPLLWVAPTDEAAVVMVGVAYSASQYVHVGHAWAHVRRDLHISLEGVGRSLLTATGMSVLLAAVLLVAYQLLGLGDAQPRWELLVKTALAGLVGVLPIGVLMVALRRRIRRTPAAGAPATGTEAQSGSGTRRQQEDGGDGESPAAPPANPRTGQDRPGRRDDRDGHSWGDAGEER